MRYCILIPAYKPDQKLVDLVTELNRLRAQDTDILIVDDGGKEPFLPVFEEVIGLGAIVLTHAENRGKGAALKTGLAYAKENNYDIAVTADADGQHLPVDIINCLEHSKQNADKLTLGVRDTKQMPLRSKTGNRITTGFFFLMFGKYLKDTQTGLRGIPSTYFDRFKSLSGDRYEYEMNMLIYCVKHNIGCTECAIQTIYLDNNSSSHFNDVKDGLKVYALIMKQVSVFTIMSLCSFLLDFTLFGVLNRIVGWNLLSSTVLARAVSSVANYMLNRKFVFKKGSRLSSFFKYYMLVGLIIALNYGIMFVLVHILKMDSLVAKVITEFGLYFFSFKMQQMIVFANKKSNKTKEVV